MEKRIPWVILFSFAVLLFSGCGAKGYQQSYRTQIASDEMVEVKINVLLEKAFVQSNSNLGAGAIAMWALLGPFSNSAGVPRL